MTEPRLHLLVVALMMIVTYATRAGGLLIMRFVPLTPRVEHVLHCISCSALASLVVPLATRGDMAALLGLASTIVVMLILRQTLLALVVAVCVTALMR